MAGKPTWHLIETKCPVCGKLFFPYPEHVYKDKRNTHKRVCSWSCVLKSERLKEAKAAKKSTGKRGA